ncbi:MAG: C40 family peptidase [Bacteroidetes bacterium]|nr:C40 family peptidase [Bacteroidota bacterium]
MKKKFYIFICISISAFFTSCKSFQSLSTKNTSTNNSGKASSPVFIDDINVTPDSRRGTITMTPEKDKKKANIVMDQDGGDMTLANTLQMKYASMLNVDASGLPSLPLLHEVDIWWGTKYCMGGTTQSCIDCSALTQTIMEDVYGVDIPRTAQAQYDNCKIVKGKDSLQEGDLVFFHTTRRGISHVGMYLANNKFVHASTSQGVMISDLNDTYWKDRYRGAGRFIQN